jgi:hypothetical protein
MFVISFKQKLPNELFFDAPKKTLKLLSNLLFQLSNSTKPFSPILQAFSSTLALFAPFLTTSLF